MIEFKHYIAQQLINKELHFKCDCLIPLDIKGIIKDYSIDGNEIIFKVLVKDKLVSISENHPNMKVE